MRSLVLVLVAVASAHPYGTSRYSGSAGFVKGSSSHGTGTAITFSDSHVGGSSAPGASEGVLNGPAIEPSVDSLIDDGKFSTSFGTDGPGSQGYSGQGAGSEGFGGPGEGSQGFAGQGAGSEGFGGPGGGSQGFAGQGTGSEGFEGPDEGVQSFVSQSGGDSQGFAGQGVGSQGFAGQGGSSQSFAGQGVGSQGFIGGGASLQGFPGDAVGAQVFNDKSAGSQGFAGPGEGAQGIVNQGAGGSVVLIEGGTGAHDNVEKHSSGAGSSGKVDSEVGFGSLAGLGANIDGNQQGFAPGGNAGAAGGHFSGGSGFSGGVVEKEIHGIGGVVESDTSYQAPTKTSYYNRRSSYGR